MTVPLTSLSHGAGCGCKLSAADLRPIVAGLPRPSDPRVLVATDTADDAGVVQLTPEIAIVQTADFFTPIVDDPYWFGRIAATNALSDVYAMGGTPVSALNLVAFPLETLGRTSCGRSCAAATTRWPRRAPRSSAGTRSTTPSPSTGWRSRASSTRARC